MVLPSSLLTFDAKAVLLHQDWAKELKFLNRKMAETFHALHCKLEMLKNSQIGEDVIILEYKLKLAHEETDLLEKVKSLIAKADQFGCFSTEPHEKQHIPNYTQSFYKVNLEYLQDHLAFIKGCILQSDTKMEQYVPRISRFRQFIKTENTWTINENLLRLHTE